MEGLSLNEKQVIEIRTALYGKSISEHVDYLLSDQGTHLFYFKKPLEVALSFRDSLRGAMRPSLDLFTPVLREQEKKDFIYSMYSDEFIEHKNPIYNALREIYERARCHLQKTAS